ncbi:50S ribosomal protein HLP, mitochondrial-like protein [Tanacetum coccineum]|uniref:50S ribosomal protein HLP, mitochondrial-like protein n=1 Tax=Tanacetum coccineum TaxID=301880 RepID=A0ABQ5CCY3_9ASTR
MASRCSDQDAKDALSKLLQMGTVVEYQSEFKNLISRVTGISENLLASFFISGLKLKLQLELLRSYSKPTTLGEAFYLAHIVEALAPTIEPKVVPEAIVHEGLVNDPAEGLKVVGTHPMAETKREMGIDNEVGGGTKSVAHTEALPRHVLVGGDEATWEGMPNSQSTYFPCHLVGKVSFEDVGSVTASTAEGERRMLCYVQGNTRRKRKRGVGYGSKRQEHSGSGRRICGRVRIWDPGITSFSRHHLEGKVDSKEWGMIRLGQHTLEVVPYPDTTPNRVVSIDLLRARPTTLGEAFALARITEAHFEDERATTVIAKLNDLNIAVQVQDGFCMVATYEEHGCQDGLKPVTTRFAVGKKGDLGVITSKGGLPDHMQASEKELVVLKSPLEQKSMSMCQERMLRRQEQQRLAKDAKIQRRIWDPGIKSLQDITLRARVVSLRLLSRSTQQYMDEKTKMWDVGGDEFGTMEDTGFLELAQLSLDEPDLESVGKGTLNKKFHTNEIQSESGRQLRRKTSYGGDTIVASVKEAQPGGKVKKGQVVYGVVVRAAMQKGRCDGSEVKFDDNAVVLVNKQGEPIGTRVFGPVPHELRKKKHVKILSLAQHIA